MTTKSLIVLIANSFTISIFPQLEFILHTVTTDLGGGRPVFAADLDNDEDIDVLSASRDDNKIAWYENDGNENFTAHIITTNADGAHSVFAIDIDNDEDIDLLSASFNDNKIAWYENDGNNTFSSHIITTSAISARSVYAIGLDSDGDIAVLYASAGDDQFAWYENDGDQNFIWHNIATGFPNAWSIYAADIDGDQDNDILATSIIALSWFGNSGVVSIDNDETTIPASFNLDQNYPNPFNPSTITNYQLKTNSFVKLRVYNTLGEEVAMLVNQEQPAGTYEIIWNADDLPSGAYYYQLKAEEFLKTKKMILIK